MITEPSVINRAVYKAKVFTFNKSDVLKLPRELCQRYGIDETVTFEISTTDRGFLFAPKRAN